MSIGGQETAGEEKRRKKERKMRIETKREDEG